MPLKDKTPLSSLPKSHPESTLTLRSESRILHEDKRIEMGKKSKENIKKFLDTDIEIKWHNLLKNGEIHD